MEVRVAHAPVRDPPHVRRLDRAAEHVHRPVPDVIPRQEQHVRRTLGRLRRQKRLPVRRRVPDVELDLAVELLGHAVAPLGPRVIGSYDDVKVDALFAP